MHKYILCKNFYITKECTFMVLNKLIINFDNKEKTIIPYEHQYFIHAYILSELKKFNEKLA